MKATGSFAGEGRGFGLLAGLRGVRGAERAGLRWLVKDRLGSLSALLASRCRGAERAGCRVRQLQAGGMARGFEVQLAEEVVQNIEERVQEHTQQGWWRSAVHSLGSWWSRPGVEALGEGALASGARGELPR